MEKPLGDYFVLGNPPHVGLYLLFANGDNVDFEHLERELKKVDHYPLGPFCYLIESTESLGIFQFSEAVSMVLPLGRGKAELLLCHLDRSAIVHSNEGGLGLTKWLTRNGRY